MGAKADAMEAGVEKDTVVDGEEEEVDMTGIGMQEPWLYTM
jgi:hypothetical protein